ncbi:MAG: DUF3095 domain-containing protein [Balneolaceae bacterium]|nr:DUF3095 domain-containing protein [Balneolaceae bacterium]
MTDNSNFYDNLPEFSDFRKVSDGALYHPVPDDWWIIAGDIRNSTEAIENGKYKEVNMAGASIIAGISNLFKDFGSLPFTFGGDGSIVLVPDQKHSEIKQTLAFCRQAIQDSFGLDMRTGSVPVADVRKEGLDVKVAKMRLSETTSQAVFWGDGLEYAESLIKDKEKDEDEPQDGYVANLEGLECRWQEIPPDQEEITSYIIKATGKNDTENSEIYEECLKKIDDIYGSLNDRNPISEAKLIFKKSWKKLAVEWKIRTWKPTLKKKLKYAWKLLFQLTSGIYLMKSNTETKNTDWGRYKSDLIKHVDFRKFSEALRFVASGTSEERMKVEDFLEEMHNKGKLFYGVHSSNSLIITCYVTNYHREHIHFVDGMDGGYAMAAKKMKKQVKESR